MRGLIFDFLHTRTQKLEVSTNTTIHDCTAKFRFILTKRRRCGGGSLGWAAPHPLRREITLMAGWF